MQRSSTSQAPAAARHSRLEPSSVQVPSLVAPWATLHASQAPAQGRLQQTPSAHEPDRHSWAVAQTVPAGFLAEQYVPLHQVLGGQPALHRKGQSTSVPLHTTLAPHAGLPGLPWVTGRQAPTAAGRSQRSQLPLQALSQQTPSAQKVDAHSPFEAQPAPASRTGLQPPSLQKVPGTHCRALVQVVGQSALSPSQALGWHAATAEPSGLRRHSPSWPASAQV